MSGQLCQCLAILSVSNFFFLSNLWLSCALTFVFSLFIPERTLAASSPYASTRKLKRAITSPSAFSSLARANPASASPPLWAPLHYGMGQPPSSTWCTGSPQRTEEQHKMKPSAWVCLNVQVSWSTLLHLLIFKGSSLTPLGSLHQRPCSSLYRPLTLTFCCPVSSQSNQQLIGKLRNYLCNMKMEMQIDLLKDLRQLNNP